MSEMEKWQNAVEKARPRFEKISEQTQMSWAQESVFASQLIRHNDMLKRCDPETIRDSIINVATVGLTLNPAHKLAYLVPRDGRCCLDISYIGMLRIATDTGSVRHAAVELVYSNDKIEWRGKHELPKHTFDPFSDDRGEFRGAYVMAKLSDGDWLCDHMAASEIYKIRDLSKAYKDKQGNVRQNSVWVKWFEEMVKKTIIKRASKTWPKSDRLRAAADIVDQHEGFDEAFNAAKNVTPSEPQELPIYPDESFQNNFNAWAKSINNGKKTPEEVIQMVSTKYQLTEDQKAVIRSIPEVEKQTEQSTEE